MGATADQPSFDAISLKTVDFKAALAQAKIAASHGEHRLALATLFGCLSPESDYVDQARAAKTLAAIDLGALRLRPLRLALVAASTMEHLAPVLRLHLAAAGFDAEVMVAPFDTTVASVLDPDSALHRFKPDATWLFATHRDVALQIPPDATPETRDQSVARAVATRTVLWDSLRRRLGCLVIDNLVDLPAQDPFGNLAGAAPWGRRAMLRRYNVALAEAAPPGVALFDLDHIAGLYGTARWDDARYWFHSRHAFGLDATGLVAHAAARLVAGARGLARKCLVLDLDNTLWGGVIGDDLLAGIRLGSGADGEAFVAFQLHVKALKERGVILAACSKNDHETAAAVFRDHPDTVLRLEDFAAFVANWDNKADNIRDIAARLNIGLDSLVFVDDNPLERDIVHRHLPEVAVVNLPEDPSGFVEALAAGRWFEAIAFSSEDRDRSRYYAENARREAVRAAFVDMDEYLGSLGMIATVGGPDAFHLPRMAQLVGKSNQFHLTGTRYTEADLAALAGRPGWFVRRVHLADRFGDNGLIAVLVAEARSLTQDHSRSLTQDHSRSLTEEYSRSLTEEYSRSLTEEYSRSLTEEYSRSLTEEYSRSLTLHIDTWVMSCRVLGRTVEAFIANELQAIARAAGCDRIVGRYVPSAKNRLVADLYPRLGFAWDNQHPDGTTTWTIEAAAPLRTTWVRIAQAEEHAA